MRWLAGMVLCGVAQPVFAQVTYQVFPVLPSDAGASAQPAEKHGSGVLVTLVIQDSTVRYVVNDLARQAHMKVLYYNSAVLSQRVKVHMVHVSLMDAFGIVLHGTGLEAKLLSDGVTIAIHPRSGSQIADGERLASGVISGRVTDSASGQGLGGAQVHVAGVKSLSTVTSDSGNFTLRDVPLGDQVLQVRLFGYRPATRAITVVDSESPTVKIVMVPVPTVLSGVVTTATGLQRKVEVGNDITTINVDSVMQTAAISSVTDLLETRVPGLTVLHSSGTPGDPSRLRLRGVGSLTGNNDPIVIIDGVRVYASQSDSRNNNLAPGSGGIKNPTTFTAPSPLDQIDPASIETIEVLKGPSASSLYGSDAAAGVIVITTKHGHAGPTHWTLGLGQGVSWLPGAWPANQFKFGTGNQNVGTGSPFCIWNDPTCVVDSVVSFQALNDPRYTVFSHGSNQTANLAVFLRSQIALTETAMPAYGHNRSESRWHRLLLPVCRPFHNSSKGKSSLCHNRPPQSCPRAVIDDCQNSTRRFVRGPPGWLSDFSFDIALTRDDTQTS